MIPHSLIAALPHLFLPPLHQLLHHLLNLCNLTFQVLLHNLHILIDHFHRLIDSPLPVVISCISDHLVFGVIGADDVAGVVVPVLVQVVAERHVDEEGF